ncbi:hypothetical protein [Streptomyces mirabilis]|uniref:hypothetical protein n=1 Tax=Streptomyces mirabilis TaxID=68239 RepID=UPI0033BF2AB6
MVFHSARWEVLGALAAPGQLLERRPVGLGGAFGGLLMVAVDRYREDTGRLARAPCFDEEGRRQGLGAPARGEEYGGEIAGGGDDLAVDLCIVLEFRFKIQVADKAGTKLGSALSAITAVLGDGLEFELVA